MSSCLVESCAGGRAAKKRAMEPKVRSWQENQEMQKANLIFFANLFTENSLHVSPRKGQKRVKQIHCYQLFLWSFWSLLLPHCRKDWL